MLLNMKEKFSIEYCRKILERSGKKYPNDKEVEIIRDQLYLLVDVELNYTLSTENIDRDAE